MNRKMPWQKTDKTHYHAHKGLSDKDRLNFTSNMVY